MQRIAEQVQKLVTTKELFKDDSPEYNILSEQAVKKIHEAGNCELHKLSKELTKYNVNVATHTLRLDFKHVHAEDKLNMSEEMLSSIRLKF